MIKQIVSFSQDPGSACQWYRTIPFVELRRHSDVAVTNASGKIGWETFAQFDIAFFQRPYTANHLALVKLAKKQCPVWVDWDDDVFMIPESNPYYSEFATQEVRDNIGEALRLADVITVSTPGIQKNLGGIVVPNAYNDYKLPTEYSPWENVSVLWRGGNTHVADLLAHKAILDQAIAENPEVKFTFMSLNPWMLAPQPNIIFIPEHDLFTYHELLGIIKPSVVIVPLENNQFNRGKSNIAWLETARFGSTCLAPRFEEWDRPGIGIFSDRLSVFVKEPVPPYQLSWNYIQDNLFLSKVNKQRLEIINEIS
jgi:hypothetical protein